MDGSGSRWTWRRRNALAPTESETQSAAHAKVVLMVVHGVIESREIVVNFGRMNDHTRRKRNAQSPARGHRECVGRAGIVHCAGRIAAACVRRAEKSLSKRTSARRGKDLAARPDEIRSQGEVLSRAVNIRRVLGRDFTDCCPMLGQSSAKRTGATVHAEATAASWRRVGVNEIVLNAGLPSGQRGH